MENFVFSYPTKNYFGKEAAKQALNAELPKYGKTSCWLMAAAASNATASMMKSWHFFRNRAKRSRSFRAS